MEGTITNKNHGFLFGLLRILMGAKKKDKSAVPAFQPEIDAPAQDGSVRMSDCWNWWSPAEGMAICRCRAKIQPKHVDFVISHDRRDRMVRDQFIEEV